MAGSVFAMILSFPGTLLDGNGTGIVLVNDRVPRQRRAALEAMVREIPPFSLLYDRLTTFLGFHYTPVCLEMDGMRSRVTIPEALDCQLMPMANLASGQDEYATLQTVAAQEVKQQELCATETFCLQLDGELYNHSGQYGEFSSFEYRAA